MKYFAKTFVLLLAAVAPLLRNTNKKEKMNLTPRRKVLHFLFEVSSSNFWHRVPACAYLLIFKGEEGTYYYNITWTMWRYNRLQEVYRSKYFTSFPPGSLPSFDAASKQCKKYIYLINHAQKHSSREEVIYRSVYERTLGKRQLNKMVQHDFASDSLCWWYLVFDWQC